MASSSAAIKRLSAEYAAIRKGDRHSRDLYAAPLEDNIFEWHFTIMGPQKDKCPYAKGIYHGCLKFPITYPFEPPDVLFFTPNGRFETNVKVCTSVSSFHKNGWRPSFDVVFILSSLRLFMENHDDIGVGGIYKSSMSDEARVKMAEESWNFVCAQCNNNETMKMLYDREMAQHDNSEQDKSEHTDTVIDYMASSIKQEEEEIVKEEENRKGVANVEKETEEEQQSQPQVCEGNTELQSTKQLEKVDHINNEPVARGEINTHTLEHLTGKESVMENNTHSLSARHNNVNDNDSAANFNSNADISIEQAEHTHDTVHTNTTPHHDDNSSPEMMLRVTILRKVFNIPLKYVDRFVWCNVLYIAIILFKWFIMWWLSTSSTSAK